jgi:hypothetical protein
MGGDEAFLSFEHVNPYVKYYFQLFHTNCLFYCKIYFNIEILTSLLRYRYCSDSHYNTPETLHGAVYWWQWYLLTWWCQWNGGHHTPLQNKLR